MAVSRRGICNVYIEMGYKYKGGGIHSGYKRITKMHDETTHRIDLGFLHGICIYQKGNHQAKFKNVIPVYHNCPVISKTTTSA